MDWGISMERKNYLKEKLSKEENIYLKRIVMSARNKYIKKNYKYINTVSITLNEEITTEEESLIDIVMKNCENEVNSAMEIEKLFSNVELCKSVKALSLNEKIVLFSLYKQNKTINQIAEELNIYRGTVRKIRDKAQNKILKYLLGGNKNV